MLAISPVTRAARIAALNDQLRRDPATHGHVLFTAGVMRLIDTETPRRIAAVVMAQQQLIRLAALGVCFTGTDADRAEHRCGTFTYLGQTLVFEIEYRDHKSLRLSRDPACPKATRRLLTIKLASEGPPSGGPDRSGAPKS